MGFFHSLSVVLAPDQLLQAEGIEDPVQPGVELPDRGGIDALRGPGVKAPSQLTLENAGVVVGGAVGLGVAMMLTQFMTLGLLTLASAGGAALGYGVRVRQEKLIANRQLAEQEKVLTVIDASEPVAALPGRKRKSWGQGKGAT